MGRFSQVIIIAILCLSSLYSTEINALNVSSESTFSSVDQITSCRQRDSLILVDFFKQANGEFWTIKWDLNTPIDTWHGIKLNAQGCVECIDLDGDANCSLSVGIGNRLSGIITPRIGEIASLRYIYLGNNRLSGNIPESLFRLPNIVVIDIFSNDMIGPLPMSIGSSPQLEFLSLAGNNLTGNIPPIIGEAPNLKDLYLDNNRFTGTVPKTIGDLSNLVRLRLHNNLLTGDIPKEIGNLSNLVNLNIAENSLDGTLPKEIGNLKNLTSLIVANNQLTSTIPKEIGDCSALKMLRVCNNEFIGPLPESLGQLSNLEALQANHNNLTGVIPTEIGNCLMLAEIDIEENQISGVIPSELGQLTNMRKLNLSHNSIIGPLPSSIGGNLLRLQELQLQDNNITGPLPPEYGELPSLRSLYAQNNSIIGPLPLSIVNLNSLFQLTLQNNKIDGTIPEDIGSMERLSTLDLSNNLFSGCFPTTLLSKCDNDFNFENNGELPWEGRFEEYCSGNIQIGAPCSTSPDIDNETIQDDCSCSRKACAPTFIVMDAFICHNEVLDIGGVQITEQGQFIDSLTNTGGCDSIITVNVSRMDLGIETKNVQCANESTGSLTVSSNWSGLFDYTIKDANNEIILEGIAEKELPQIENVLDQGTYQMIIREANMACLIDTSFTINADYQAAAITYIEEVKCQGEEFTVNGVTFNEDNTNGSIDLSTLNGCDSTVVVNLSYLQLDLVQNNVACEDEETGYITGVFNLDLDHSYRVSNDQGQMVSSGTVTGVWFETERTLKAGQYTVVVETELGCTYSLPVEIDYEHATPEPTYIEETLCPEDEIIINGETYSSDYRTGEENLKSIHGCDSIVLINLEFLELPSPNDDIYEATGPYSVIDILANDDVDFNTDLEFSIVSVDNITEANIIDRELQVTIDENYTGFSTVTYQICNMNCLDVCAEATVNIQSANSEFDEDVLTPNDDGYNDVLLINGFNEYEEISGSQINVVNRWGQVVYSAENYSNDWTGNLNNDPNKPLPEGVYFYHLILSDGSSVLGSRSIIK